jgi:sugar phosphate isomerase/epimerase
MTRPRIALSTASVFPEPVSYAFEIAARLGYDGVELMPMGDPGSQDVDLVGRLSRSHELPVLSIHAPCLLITQRVWGTNPWRKLVKSRHAALDLGAETVVVHPPFRWQREYARMFEDGIERLATEHVRIAVENMYPWTKRGSFAAYLPDWDPRLSDYRDVTLDLSHTSASGSDAMEMLHDLGPRVTHVHMADGSGLPGKDEHLVPGRGGQPCAEFLAELVRIGFSGVVVLEISTRKARSREQRENDLAEALGFTRRHLDAAAAALDGPSSP